MIGLSDIAEGWTDGSSYIAINRSFLAGLKMFKNGSANPSSFYALLQLIIHEVCHDSDSRANVHSPDFYRAFHDMNHEKGAKTLQYVMDRMTPARYKSITGEYEQSDTVAEITDKELVGV
jgi:hypothetical protein